MSDEFHNDLAVEKHDERPCPECNGLGEAWFMDSLGNEHGPFFCGACEGTGSAANR